MEACCRRWIGCLVARQGRFAEARELVAAAAAAYEELGARLDAVSTAAFGRADVELLAGDTAAAESALREGYDALGNLGEIGHRASVAAMLARTLRRPRPRCGGGRARPRGARRRRPSTISGRRRSTASRRARPPRRRRRFGRGGARRRGTRSRSSNRPTCSTSTATCCWSSPPCCAPEAAPTRRASASSAGIELYEAKGNVVAVERARGTARARGYEVVTPIRAAIGRIDRSARQRRHVERRRRRRVERGELVQRHAHRLRRDDRIRSTRGRRPARARAGRARRAPPPAPAGRAGRVEVPVELPDPVHLPEHERRPSGRDGRRGGGSSVASQLCQPRSPGSTPRSAKRQSSAETAGSMRASNPSSRARRTASCEGCDVDARVAVEDGADACAAAHRPEDLLDHLLVDPPPGHTGAVQRRERARARVQRLEPGRGDRVGDDVEHVVRALDLVPRLDGELEAELDPGADDDEGAASRCTLVHVAS